VLGPLVIAVTTPAGALYPSESLYWVTLGAAIVLVVMSVLVRASLARGGVIAAPSAVRLTAILATPGLKPILLASSLCVAANDLLLVYFPVVGAARHIDAATVGWLLSLRALVAMGSRLMFSRLVGLLGRGTLLTASMAFGGIASLSLALPLPVWGYGLALCAAGFGLGLAIACSISLTLSLAPPAGRATAMSVRLTASRLSQFILPLASVASVAALGVGSIFALIGGGMLLSAMVVRARVAGR
jgi:hypothetical protein